jgi:hypothetical protein
MTSLHLLCQEGAMRDAYHVSDRLTPEGILLPIRRPVLAIADFFPVRVQDSLKRPSRNAQKPRPNATHLLEAISPDRSLGGASVLASRLCIRRRSYLKAISGN